MICYVLAEMVADMGAMAVGIADDDLRKSVTDSLEELHTLTARMKEAFPQRAATDGHPSGSSSLLKTATSNPFTQPRSRSRAPAAPVACSTPAVAPALCRSAAAAGACA
jgi:hypothetical protein